MIVPSEKPQYFENIYFYCMFFISIIIYVYNDSSVVSCIKKVLDARSQVNRAVQYET